MRAARVGSSDIVARRAKGEFMRLARLLEAGAQKIMYPRCESTSEAAEVVKWAKFPTLGSRGIDGGNADVPYGTRSPQQYVNEANQETFIIVQLEDQRAIEFTNDIAAVKGVDVLFLGPGDYSSLSGFPGQFDHPLLEKETVQISAAAQRAGKSWGRPALTLDEARRYLAMGASIIGHTSDTRLLKSSYERIQQELGELGFTFDNHFAQSAK